MPPIRPTLDPAALRPAPVWLRLCGHMPRRFGCALLLRATWRAILEH